MKESRVIIVDDESVIREGLQDWLSHDYNVSVFDSAESFLSSLTSFKDETPTCILLDLQMPGMTGIELQNELNQLNVQFPIVFMSGNAQQSDIIDAWQGGAVDFLLKPFTAAQVSSKLVKALNSDVLRQNGNGKAEDSRDIPITKREAQVLLLLGQGRQQFEVAQSLNLSLRTVKMYRTSLKNKLGLNTLMELARFYDEHHRAISKIAADD